LELAKGSVLVVIALARGANDAGWTHRNKPMLDLSEDEFDRAFSANVKPIYLMTSAVVPITQ
jgi:NAD(P)-dependent dehydrogenase (short-subunit alcohol dehydrogenase family)